MHFLWFNVDGNETGGCVEDVRLRDDAVCCCFCFETVRFNGLFPVGILKIASDCFCGGGGGDVVGGDGGGDVDGDGGGDVGCDDGGGDVGGGDGGGSIGGGDGGVNIGGGDGNDKDCICVKAES